MKSLEPSPQEVELDVLRAIYGDDWEDITPPKTAWKVQGEERWWAVTLRGEDERVSIKLRGRFTKLYPKQPPILTVEDPKSLTPGQVSTLTRLINEKAKEFAQRSEESIFEIGSMVNEYLTEHHVPLPKPGEIVPTLMEEMAQREEAKRAAQIAQSRAQLESARAHEEEQNRRLNEQIQLDSSRKAEKATQAVIEESERRRQESLAALADGELEMRELSLDHAFQVDGHDGSFSHWVLFGGRKEMFWTSYTAEPDATMTGFVKASLPTITAQVVDFSTPSYSTQQGQKKIEAIVAEIRRLVGMSTENVVRVYGVKRDKSPKGWERLIILAEKVSEGGRLSKWIPKDGFGEDISREHIVQVLSGLSEIHKRGATQKTVDMDSVLLAPQMQGGAIAKLCGTGYAKRIADLHRSNPFLRNYEESTPESWLSPDEIESSYTYTAKRDIWHAGLLLIQMLYGAQALHRYPNLQILLQHLPGLSERMVDLLNGMLHPNHKKRFTADEAVSKARNTDETTRRGNNRWSTGPIPIGQPMQSPQTIFSTSPANGISYFPANPQANRQSRYRTDFEEVEFLGKGGFGEVVKARNKLDGRSYAIKKVKLRPEDNEQKVYREVNSLSRVSHHHIVRYYGCWLEDATPPQPPPTEDGPTPTAPPSSEEEDIFALNFDDISRRDQSRSASFPRIRFANSGEDEEEEDADSEDSTSDSSDDSSDSDAATAADLSDLRERGRMWLQSRPAQPAAVPPKPSMSLTGTTTDDESVQRILYIQMEFVEKQTLREAITAGLSDEEVWRLLVQILQALSHMSSLGIVHRDLKPSNILLDASGNVKIADFGLSTTEMTVVEAASANNTLADFSDRTSGIGTSLYIAPEVAISRSYNEKADMYSLGIIFFEMCFAFKTHMERVHILTALRQSAVTFPLAWPKGTKQNQREIVESLLRHDPSMRPGAAQLLASPLLPSPEKHKEYYDTAIAELTNPRSTQYPALLEALFDNKAQAYTASLDNRLEDYTYDNDHDDELQVWLTVVVQRLVDLLQRHGAVETYLPLFIPETTLLRAFPDLSPVRLLDSLGKVVQLPCSDLLGMARSATRRQIERIKRYHVGYRYGDHPAGGQPKVSGELSYDIVSPIRSPVAEAELLEVVDKVISEFRGMRGTAVDYEFHISHETVLATILNSVPDRSRSAVLKALKGFGSGTTLSHSKLLLNGVTGLSKQLSDELEQCCVIDEFEIVRAKVENLFPSARRKLLSALDAMASIIALARACGVSRRILFRPTLSKNAEFFRGGFMFECVRRGKQRELIAFGGRYDSLLEHFKEPAQQMQSRKVYGVGMSIAVDQLARMVRKYESSLSNRLMSKDNEDERSYGFWSPARCDVYVASVSQVDTATRLNVIGELWRAGISADLQYDDERSLEEVAAECIEQNTLFLVIPRANRPVVKVRSILKRSEEEVTRNELCTYLRHAIAEQRRVDASYASAEGSIPSAQAAALSAVNPGGAENKQEVDIKLVLPPEPGLTKGGNIKQKPVRKHRHVTKTVYYDKASEFATWTKSSLPIIGVDLPHSILSAMTLDTAWLNDDEQWRAFLSSSVSPSDRRYVDTIRDAVKDMSRGGSTLGTSVGSASGQKGWMWLFSVREARGFLLQPK